MNTSIRNYLVRFVSVSALIAAALILVTRLVQSPNFQTFHPRTQEVLLLLYKNQFAFVFCYIGISAFALTMLPDRETNSSVSSNDQADKHASSNTIETKHSLENASLQEKRSV